MADGGEMERREGSRDGGDSGPIYRMEGFEAKLRLGEVGLGRDALDGEVATRGVALRMAGRRGASPAGQGRVASGGEAS